MLAVVLGDGGCDGYGLPEKMMAEMLLGEYAGDMLLWFWTSGWGQQMRMAVAKMMDMERASGASSPRWKQWCDGGWARVPSSSRLLGPLDLR